MSRQRELVEWFNKNLACPYELSTRNQRLAHTCHDLAIEHHAAILLLCRAELFGSMYSLLRVEFKALARGLWLRHVASNEDIVKYETEDFRIGFGDILKQIENRFGLASSVLSRLKNRQWDIFNSFTHTGYQALVRRVNSTHTGPVNYNEEEVVSALRHARLFAIFSVVELAGMARDKTILEPTMAMALKYGE